MPSAPLATINPLNHDAVKTENLPFKENSLSKVARHKGQRLRERQLTLTLIFPEDSIQVR